MAAVTTINVGTITNGIETSQLAPAYPELQEAHIPVPPCPGRE